MSSISQRIVKLRKEHRLNQKDFAHLIGVSQPSLIKFERGETDIIPIGVAKKIAKELITPFNELFEIEDSQTLLLKEQIKDLEMVITNLESELEKRGQFVDSLLAQLKMVRTYLVDFVVDTYNNWVDEYLDYNKSSEWNMEHLSQVLKESQELRDIIKKLSSELKWCIRSGLFSPDDYEQNLAQRKESKLPVVDILKLSSTFLTEL